MLGNDRGALKKKKMARTTRAAVDDPDTAQQQRMALRDQLFGSRGYTEGARYQLPRKIPLRIEPKTYFGG